jgi:hypothetical protein
VSAATPTQDVFELALARPVVAADGEHQALVHLWWSAPQQGDRIVQVYVDGRLADVSVHPSQREMWLMLDRSRSHRIELLAVQPGDGSIWAEHRERLATWDPPFAGPAAAAVIRDPRLPVDTNVSIAVDGEPAASGPMWPADEHRGGFGALFAEGAFGWDTATAPGLGMGELGMGPLGEDGTAWSWQSDELAPGTHELALSAFDRTGQATANPVAFEDIDIETLPAAAVGVAIDDDFTLSWTA